MLQRAILVAVILSANCVLFPTTSVALDGTDGCIGSVVQLSVGAAKQLRCSKISPCTTSCSKLDVLLVFPDETEVTAKICNCDGTTDDNCCSIALAADGEIYATGRCAGNQLPGQNCPAGQLCGMSLPTPDDYPRVFNTSCF